MKFETVLKFVKKSVSTVERVEYVQQFDFYIVIVTGCVTMYELNALSRFFDVSHVGSSSVGTVELICRLKKIDFTPYYLHERGVL